MILATKIALPTVDIVTDALGINKVLSLPAPDTYEQYAERTLWDDPRIDGCWYNSWYDYPVRYKCPDTYDHRRQFTKADWMSFTESERTLFANRYYKYANLFPVAYAMVGIMVLSWLMTLPHFCRIERSLWQKIKALPFLICCSWPQYRATRLMWLAYWVKNEEKFNRENMEFEDTLSHIGKSKHS